VKYFYDTEFIENGPSEPIYFMSIGIVSEDGREYYAENSGCPLDRANDWVKANVIPHLGSVTKQNRYDIKRDVEDFMDIQKYGKPELWGYYADYDHVVFSQLFGRMVDLPVGFPMYTNDLKQLVKSMGNPRLPAQGKDEHHALKDAQWIKACYDRLQTVTVVSP
jgi:hypothetical protein